MKLHNLILLLGIGFLLANSIMFTDAFIRAFMSEDKSITIFINHYGEAIPELIMLLGSFPLTIYAVIWGFNEVRRRETDGLV